MRSTTRLDHRLDGGVPAAPVLVELVGVQRQVAGEVLAEDVLGAPRRPGRSILIFTSRRPGRRIAGSIMSSRLEAPMTMTFSRPSTPSISDEQLGHDRVLDVGGDAGAAGAEDRVHLVEEDDDGGALGGLLAGTLEDQADVPLGLADVLVEQLGALDVEEVALALFAGALSATCLARELATALAMRVLPQPGGPYSRTPFGGLSSCSRKRSACR